MALTLDDLAAHLNLPGNVPPTDPGDRAELQRMLDAALRRVRAACGFAGAGPSTVPAASNGGTALVLPVARLASIGIVLDPDGNEVAPVRVDTAAGVVHVPVGRPGVWRVTVVHDDLPEDLEVAALIIAKHLYETQRMPRSQARPGGAPPAPSGAGFAIPNRAAELMAPYMLPGIA